ncbi:tyrosine-type recombinase/integrase [Pseudoduganella namucuonensis]|uniref:Site-specific recombinase XerD n=1 Tax=Pseudoduganella namucuonensis TaxID=1035707 RepID=A0A1I7LUD1_9BURK|nr:tyrosine-type recombinase/integrase [Pseudoduganella namucuonensis]SFV13258.1 Site-specific recombinase XerD [Pseudoduganella namucuonensis]
MSPEGEGNWAVRTLRNGQKIETSLGKMEAYRPSERFDQALVAAQAFAFGDNLPQTCSEEPQKSSSFTVWDACIAYIHRARDIRGDSAANDLAERYQRWIDGNPIQQLPLADLKPDHLRDFRRQLAATPAKANYSGGTRARAKSTVNRDLAALRAALNYAHTEGKIGSDSAWKVALKAIANATQRRRLYLEMDQRRALADAAQEDIRLFIRGMALLPLRPGALAALDVRDYDPRLPALLIGKDKGGHDRTILLPTAAVPILQTTSRDKSEQAPLFSRADGARWTKDSWNGPIKTAARKAGLPANTTAYTIRHSVITDLVHGGLDLLTVAQISGTSVAMIEKHYGHLRGDVAAGALARLVL